MLRRYERARSLLGEGREAAAAGDANALAERFELAVALQAVDRRRDDGSLDAGALGDFGGGDTGVLKDRFDDPLLVGALGGAAVAARLGPTAGAADRLARVRVGVDPGLGEQRGERQGRVRARGSSTPKPPVGEWRWGDEK